MEAAKRYLLPKSERLSLKKEIDRLFESGDSFIAFPLRIKYLELPSDTAANSCMMVSVPKKRVKKAVARNRIKRRIREAYRLNKNIPPDKRLHIAFLYIADEVLPYRNIENSVVKAFVKINNKIET